MIKEKTTREKVEEWLLQAPTEIILSPIKLEQKQEYIHQTGKLTPKLLKGIYYGEINFLTKEWE